jgi:tyrosine-protein phosphatase YwqE
MFWHIRYFCRKPSDVLSFLRQKPFLRDLFPPDYTDIHSHLLPGIDDGAKDLSVSAALIGGMKKLGIARAVTTPHIMRNVWDNTPETVNEKLRETKASVSDKAAFPLRAAAEYLIDDHFVTLYKNEEILTLKDNLVLVEMSYLNPPIQLPEILFDLQVAGYRPVLAHPERYMFYHARFDEFKKLKNAGCLFQLNLLSTVGYYGPAVTVVAEKLLRAGMIDFTGTDMHHSKHLEALWRRMKIKDSAQLQKAMENNSLFGF